MPFTPEHQPSFSQKPFQNCLFQSLTSVFHLLSLPVSQCFFSFNCDILPYEEQTPFYLDFVAFFTIVFEFFCCLEFETNALSFSPFWLSEKLWWRTSEVYGYFHLVLVKVIVLRHLFWCEVLDFSLIFSFLSLLVLITTRGCIVCTKPACVGLISIDPKG